MGNKERVLEELLNITKGINGKKDIGVTAMELSKRLSIQRSLVSHILNSYCSEGKAIKINTRPVFFLHKGEYENNEEKFQLAKEMMKSKNKEEDNEIFSALIGYDGSLKEVIKECKSAAHYPPNGLPFILVGPSGVGKSFLARLVYDYSVKSEMIEKNAPFIHFNCAEYANNKELLSATLFGAMKGAYTGADKDKIGLIEEGNGGILFLDEIHRLSPEGQEKLFLFLDKGVYRRLGEVGRWRNSNVRLIFATTENLEENFLLTFLRRIPLVVSIPPFENRPFSEKLQLIKRSYKKEGENILRNIEVSKGVLSLLLNCNECKNIGKLINIIKISCASAFQREAKSSVLKISIMDLPKSLSRNEKYSEEIFEDIKIVLGGSTTNKSEIYEGRKKEVSKLNKLIEENTIEERRDFFSLFSKEIYDFTDKIAFNGGEKNLVYYSIREVVEKKLQDAYYPKGNIAGNIYEIISYVLMYFIDYDDEFNVDIVAYYKEKYKNEYLFSTALINEIDLRFGTNISTDAVVYMLLYLRSLSKGENLNRINTLILAHGYSTASNISTTINRMLEKRVFEGIDLPLDMKFETLKERVFEYIEERDNSLDLLILVDMGSLELIYKEIIKKYRGNIGVVNNITTSLALYIGTKIIGGEGLEDILKSLPKSYEIKTSYYPCLINRKKVIITTCITGIGTAKKIKELLVKSLKIKEGDIIPLDYKYITENRKELLEKYDIKLVVGTHNPEIGEFLSIEGLISKKEERKLVKSLENHLNSEDIESIDREIVKFFSFENVVNNLTILNPSKIIEQIEESIFNLERLLKIKLANEVKIGLYVHTCCMVERLVIKDPIPYYTVANEEEKCYEHFEKMFKMAFSVIEQYYRIEIPQSEIGIMFESLKNKIGIKPFK